MTAAARLASARKVRRWRRMMRAAEAAKIRRRNPEVLSFPRYIRTTCDDQWRQSLSDIHSRLALGDWRRGVAWALADLERSHAWEGARPRARRWSLCGRSSLIVVRECIHTGDTPQLIPLPCDLRSCPDCARRRQADVARKYAQILAEQVIQLPRGVRHGKRFRAVTLTRRNPGGYDPDRLRTQIIQTRRLVSDFLRRVWIRRGGRRNRPGVGAVFGVEVSPSGMVHAHCLVYGEYVDQEELSELWASMTPDASHVVDIREVRVPLSRDPTESLHAAVVECLKYSAKPIMEESETNLRAVAAIEYAFAGTRRLGALGIFYGHVGELELRHFDVNHLECQKCGCPAHVGRIMGPTQTVHALARGATWYPGRAPPGWPEEPE